MLIESPLLSHSSSCFLLWMTFPGNILNSKPLLLLVCEVWTKNEQHCYQGEFVSYADSKDPIQLCGIRQWIFPLDKIKYEETTLMPFDAPLTLSSSAPELSCWYSSRDPKEHKLLKLKRASPVVQPRHRILQGREKPKVMVFLNQCRSQICWHESWALFNNIMSVKIYIATELFHFLFPALEKLITGSLGHLRSTESQGFVCVYLFIVESNHDPLIRDQGHLGSSRGGLTNSEPFAFGSSVIK